MYNIHAAYTQEACVKTTSQYQEMITCSHNPHGEYGVVGHLRIAVMGKLAQRIQNL